ncbi:LLM class flavin-dependent oxidoreductase [Niallia oryzisoli]|uniref:LLM class flavin-dependent oxidoreductase n=1 Tax=Niallia oryzisoli TaxID=1737571 RepID=UPI0037352592
MKLSILDQAPISANQTAQEALVNSLKLAQAGEKLGYTRYWIAEHHNLPGLACSAPEVMLSYIGANTTKIRLGSGAVLLPHYKPYKVAEVFNLLATLFPNRIDIGIGRAPGGSAEATNALSDNFLQNVWKMPALVKELIGFLENDFPAVHDYSGLSASPLPETAPVPWLLGTGKKSAFLAAENGIAYAFGQFMSDQDGVEIVKQYRDTFIPRKNRHQPKVILTVSVICAETNEKAEELAISWLIWQLQKEKEEQLLGVPSIEQALKYKPNKKETMHINKMKENIIIGNPNVVKKRLQQLQVKYQADEMMIVTITYSIEDKIHSYQLVAEELLQ